MLADEYMANPYDKEPFLRGTFDFVNQQLIVPLEIVNSWPILIELTKQYGIKFESDDSSDQDDVSFVPKFLFMHHNFRNTMVVKHF